MPLPKALIYCRVSTEEQADDGHYSLQTQERLCRKMAEEAGYTIVGVLSDPGKSGRSLDRPGLQDLLIRCREEKDIEAVFVQDTDRLARNTGDHLTIRTLLQKYGVKFISASQPTIDGSPEGMMIDTIIAAVNQFQSDITARKTRKSMEQKVKEGWFPGWAPLGYLNVENPQHGQHGASKRIIVPDPQTAPLIQEAFRLYATGDPTLEKLADILSRKGLRSQTGKTLLPGRLHGILKNPFYIGELHWGGCVISQAQHQPLVDRITFLMVQSVLAAHNHHACRRRKHSFLLRGFVYCGQCGRRYTAEHHKSRGIAYYHCPKKNGCDQYVEVGELEQQVAERFKEIQLSEAFVQRVVTRVRAVFGQRQAIIEHQKRELSNKKLALERKRDLVEEKLLQGVLSDDDFTRLRTNLKEELTGIQHELDDVEYQKEVDLDEIQAILRFARKIAETYHKAPYELKRHYLGFFWEKFVVKAKSIDQAIPTRLFQALLAERAIEITPSFPSDSCVDDAQSPQPSVVIIGQEWRPRPTSIITPVMEVLQDVGYTESLLRRFAMLKQFMQEFSV